MNSLLANPNPLTFYISYLPDFILICIEWAVGLVLSSSQTNIQCKSKSRVFSQEGSRWKVRLDLPTALTVPRPKVQGETLPTYRDTLSAGVRGGDGKGRGRAPHLYQLCGRLWGEHKGTFFSLWALLPSRPPLHVYGPTASQMLFFWTEPSIRGVFSLRFSPSWQKHK